MSYISASVDRDRVMVWERSGGHRTTKIFQAPAEFYIKDPRGASKSIWGDKLRRLTFKSLRDMRTAREQNLAARIEMFESDVNPAIKILSQHYYGKKGEKLNVTFLDIENDYDPMRGYASVKNPYAPINAVALYHEHKDKAVVLAVPPPGWDGDLDMTLLDLGEIRLFETERELLEELLNEIEDSDALCGWNSQLFDFPYIGKRIEIVLGEESFRRLSFDDALPPRWREQVVFNSTHELLSVGGRILADYMLLYKKFTQGERESFKLESIAEEELEDLPKLPYTGSLADLYHKNFNYFLRYNLRDTEILKGFEQKLGFVDLAILMFREATGLFENVTGTVRLADYSIYNYCHHVLDVRVPDIKNNSEVQVSLKGAHVLDPTPGMYEWIGSVDVTSLYPSCIRSVNVSPETIIGQFMGNGEDVHQMFIRSDAKLLFKDEATGKILTETAATWRKLFDENNCAVSGHGTVFSMDEPGILPAILERWFNQRTEVNARISEIDNLIMETMKKYETQK